MTDAGHSNYVRVFMVAIRRKLEPDPAHPATSSPSRAPACASCPEPGTDPPRTTRWPYPPKTGTRELAQEGEVTFGVPVCHGPFLRSCTVRWPAC